MKILAVILARKNSKRLKLKNKKKLGKYPLFLWSVFSASKIKNIQDILVSTDDKDIEKICNSKKICVLKRPKNLSKDNTSSANSAIHAVSWYQKNFEKVGAVLLLQPTSPFRLKKTIIKAINLFLKNNYKPVVSVSKLKHQLYNLYEYSNKRLTKKTAKKENKKLYAANGVIYIIKFSDLKKTKSFLTKNIIPLELSSPKEILDIDDKNDFELAKLLLGKNI